MIGVFVINDVGEIAFAQFGTPVRIEGFRYVEDVRLCVVLHSSGQEELFTRELEPTVTGALAKISEILVAHIAENGETELEYVVPVIK